MTPRSPNLDPDAIDLTSRHCTPCEGGTKPMDADGVRKHLVQVPGWELLDAERGPHGWSEIAREFKFEDFYQTMAFVNAVAWIANTENHHPDLEVGYQACRVRYSTHAIKGLSENDFICAAKVNALLAD